MPALFPSRGQFSLVSKGIHPAVCCEFLDLGLVDTKWGKKPKGAWVFQVAERDEDGKRKEVRCTFNLVVGTAKKPSKVQKLMSKWRGRAYTQEELEHGEVDPEKPVGKPCLLDLEHTEVEDGTTIHYVDAILPPGETRLEPEGYVPVAQRTTGRRPGADEDDEDDEDEGGGAPSAPPPAAAAMPNAYRDRPVF